MDEAVEICPVTPTELPNVFPISMRSSPDIIPGIPVTNLDMNRAGRTILSDSDWLSFFSLLKMFHS